MKLELDTWLSQQKDVEEYFLRFLKKGEFTEELNTFFEIKNRIPIAITGVGAIIYAEIFENEILFSILYMDQNIDTHLSDSIEDFENLLKNATAKAYDLHIANCGIDNYGNKYYDKKSNIKLLVEKFGPLQQGEIFGYADAVFEDAVRSRSVSHYVRVREIETAAKQNAQEYFLRLINKFKLAINKSSDDFYKYHYDGISYNYSGYFFTGHNITDDLKGHSINTIKDVYKCFSVVQLSNLRCFSTSSLELLHYTTRLNYFRYRDYHLGNQIKTVFSLLQNNHEIISISIIDEGTYLNDMYTLKGKLASFESLISFPLLKRFVIENVEMSHFPEELTKLKNLEIICLLKTGIESLPESLSAMTQLKQLRLSDFSLDGKLHAVCELKALTALALKNCSLISLPAALQQLSELEHLDLSKNTFTEIPEWIGKFKKLKTLNLSDCGLIDLPMSIGELTNLGELEIKGNIFKTLPKTLLKLKNKVKVEPKFKALYDEKVRKKIELLGQKPAVFTDLGFKLMVIQCLMYEKELLLPKFDVYDFVANYTERKIDIEKEGYDMIPEVKNYFEQLEIPIILLDEIEELNADGGDDIYAQISPFWGGEDDYYEVHSAKDAKQLPNLKKIDSLFFSKKNIVSQFEKMKIEVE